METTMWKCDVCGFIHEGEDPPAVCPVCGVDSSHFEKVKVAQYRQKTGARWKCGVCGYIHDGKNPPDKCPVCSVPSGYFGPVESGEYTAGSSGSVRDIVIIGAGVAGMTAAEQAAAQKGVAVTVISGEQGVPYYRLNLTRYLAREVDSGDLIMNDYGWFSSRNIKLITAQVERIVPEHKSVEFSIAGESRTISYDRLIIATGAHPFVPPFKGVKKTGVFTLRTKDDADNILSQINNGVRATIIGGGLLGLEAAGALAATGCRVTVLEGHGWVLPRQLNKTAGELLIDKLSRKNITVLTDARTKEITGSDKVESVILEDGRRVETDILIISTGVRANMYLAIGAEIDVDRGIIVNDEMQTSDRFIYAAGDAAQHRGQMYGIWPAAYLQGSTAGINAGGGHHKFVEIPRSNMLKVLDINLFSIGDVSVQDGSSTAYESENGDNYYRIVCRDGLVLGAVLLGDTALAGRLQEIIESKIPAALSGDVAALFPELVG